MNKNGFNKSKRHMLIASSTILYVENGLHFSKAVLFITTGVYLLKVYNFYLKLSSIQEGNLALYTKRISDGQL
jgi:hypothetical protein